MIKKLLTGKALPLVLVTVLGLIFLLMLLFSRKAPAIRSIEPSLALPGQTVVIQGEYFGFRARDGQLSFGGRVPPPSNIQSWNDRRIVLTVPEDAVSGLVTVANSQGISPGVLFTNAREVPALQFAEGQKSGQPFIEAVLPAKVLPGRTLQIWGDSFGENSFNSVLRFTGSRPLVITAASGSSGLIQSWADHQIVLRLPSGIEGATGVQVLTSRGLSATFSLPLSSPWKKSRARVFTLKFDAAVNLGTGSGNLTLWFPLPPQEEAVCSYSSVTPAVPSGRWDTVLPLRWEGVSKGKKDTEVQLEVTTFSWELATESALTDDKSLPSDVYPSVGEGTPYYKSLVTKWGGDSGEALSRAKKLYAGLIQNMKASDSSPIPDPKGADPQGILDSRTANSWQLSQVYTALCRTAGLGARSVFGYLAVKETLHPHFWTEVWIPAAGWVPVDTFMGIADPEGHFARQETDHIPWQVAPSAGPRFDSDARVLPAGTAFPFLMGQGEASPGLTLQGIEWKVPQIVSFKDETF